MPHVWRVASAAKYSRRMLTGFASSSTGGQHIDLSEWEGRWVAIKGGRVIEAADSSQEIMARLEQRGSEVSGAVVRFVRATKRQAINR